MFYVVLSVQFMIRIVSDVLTSTLCFSMSFFLSNFKCELYFICVFKVELSYKYNFSYS
jgi:hypothetical protein